MQYACRNLHSELLLCYCANSKSTNFSSTVSIAGHGHSSHRSRVTLQMPQWVSGQQIWPIRPSACSHWSYTDHPLRNSIPDCVGSKWHMQSGGGI